MSLWPYVRPGPEGRERLLRRFERTLDTRQLAAALAADSVAVDLDPATLAVRPVALKKDRFIIALDGRARDGAPIALVAKGYADERAATIHANHVALWEGGLGDVDGPVRTSRPIALVPSLGVTLSEWLPGQHPVPTDPSTAAMAGAAAARLHGCAARLHTSFTLAAFLDNVDRHIGLLSERAPDLRHICETAALSLRRAVPGISFEDGSPLNGDLSLGSFVIDATRTYLIDWDMSCRFDAAWDVGHFLAQLRRFGLEGGQATDAARTAFLEGYGSGTMDARGRDFDRRSAFFEAAACLHKAYTVARVGREDWHEVAGALSEAAGPILRQLARSRAGSVAVP